MAKAEEHLVSLMENSITHGEILVVVEFEIISNKRKKSTRDIDVINMHLSDAKEVAVNKADKTIDKDNVKLVVDENYQP